MIRSTTALILIGLMLLLAACGGAAPRRPSLSSQAATPTPEPTRPAEPSLPARPTPAPQPSPSPLPTSSQPAPGSEKDVVVVYRKSGGFAGINDVLTVYADGSLERQSRGGIITRAQVAPAALEQLQKLLASAEFAALQSSYKAAGADQFVYEIILPGASEPRVVTVSGAQNPPVLDQLIDELEGLRRQVNQGAPEK